LKDLLISTHEKVEEEDKTPDVTNPKDIPVKSDVGTMEGDIGFSSPFLKDGNEGEKKPVSDININ
jgi:hypothetical protein